MRDMMRTRFLNFAEALFIKSAEDYDALLMRASPTPPSLQVQSFLASMPSKRRIDDRLLAERRLRGTLLPYICALLAAKARSRALRHFRTDFFAATPRQADI